MKTKTYKHARALLHSICSDLKKQIRYHEREARSLFQSAGKKARRGEVDGALLALSLGDREDSAAQALGDALESIVTIDIPFDA